MSRKPRKVEVGDKVHVPEYRGELWLTGHVIKRYFHNSTEYFKVRIDCVWLSKEASFTADVLVIV